MTERATANDSSRARMVQQCPDRAQLRNLFDASLMPDRLEAHPLSEQKALDGMFKFVPVNQKKIAGIPSKDSLAFVRQETKVVGRRLKALLSRSTIYLSKVRRGLGNPQQCGHGHFGKHANNKPP